MRSSKGTELARIFVLVLNIRGYSVLCPLSQNADFTLDALIVKSIGLSEHECSWMEHRGALFFKAE